MAPTMSAVRVQHSTFAVPASAQQTTASTQQRAPHTASTVGSGMQTTLTKGVEQRTLGLAATVDIAQGPNVPGNTVERPPSHSGDASARRAAMRARRAELVRQHTEVGMQAPREPQSEHLTAAAATPDKSVLQPDPIKPPALERTAADGPDHANGADNLDEHRIPAQPGKQRGVVGVMHGRQGQTGDRSSVFLTATGTTIELHSRGGPATDGATEDGRTSPAAVGGAQMNLVSCVTVSSCA